MQATYKGQNITYDIECDDYSDGFHTTFYSDLTIAEHWGVKAIKDTFNTVVKSWIDDVRYFTDFTMKLNFKCWNWYNKGNNEIAELYSELYYKARDLGFKHYKDNKEDLQYFIGILD